MFNNKLVFQIEGIIDSDNGEVGSTAALNTTDKLDKNMKKMSKQDAQNLLERLEAQKWIKIVCFKRVIYTSLQLSKHMSVMHMYY